MNERLRFIRNYNMLTLTHINNQCRTNPTTLISLLDLLATNHNYYRILIGWVLHSPHLRDDSLRQHATYKTASR
jgi:hypothetical protein